MENNELIEHQNGLLQIDIDYPLFISRRSLKHFVESRKVELIRKHTQNEVLSRLFLAVENVVEIYTNSDKTSLQENNRTVYTKYSINRTQHSIRLVLEQVENKLEICSIHFQKSKKLPQG
jgi:hypothetical protein